MKKYDENSPDYQCLSDIRTCMLEQIAAEKQKYLRVLIKK